MPNFNHLHVHTQYSLLDGASDISKLMSKAVQDGQKALAITDHGNMFGVFSFVREAHKNKLKPIIGCEFYMVRDRTKKQFTKEVKDVRYHQLLLAKNAQGYSNLAKLCSLGWTEGLYGKYPRIDKELLLEYKEGLIATSCCIGAEIPQLILHQSEEAAEEALRWWYDVFGEDYYIELQRHGHCETKHLDDHRQRATKELAQLQEKVNATLLRFAAKYQIKTICTNDAHYVDQEDFNMHDILLCVNTGDFQSTPIATDEEGGKGYRFGFPNDQFYFKSQDEMRTLFKDLPEAVDYTNEIVDKVDSLKLEKDIILPSFPLPPEFDSQHAYLEHLTYQGAKERYGEIHETVRERIEFELFTIKTMNFSGYFLIVSDFINAGRNMQVVIGPGRGSAAGSVVAYCLGITNIDPIKYQLLFERFLHDERTSLPDIDSDFDDEGRDKVINYVINKYGKDHVAQIVTFGSMAAKNSIKDVARVMQLPLSESIALANLVPTIPGIKLKRMIHAPLEGGDDSIANNEKLGADDIANITKLRDFEKEDSLQGSVIRTACKLEGSLRNSGVHPAGIIIASEPVRNILPVCVAKDSELVLTQYEGDIIEKAGVIKMDILGLKTLTIVRDALQLVQKHKGKNIDLDKIPLDDPLTFQIFQKGDTAGIFQFESAGMQKYLKDLKPDQFEDLIAMAALFRPGPMQYIPNYINRKYGREEIHYDLPEMEPVLDQTYGVTVYQEQVMLISQRLAGFNKAQADNLRSAMGKKDKAKLESMEHAFKEGGAKNGFRVEVLNKIWDDWQAFAHYAFNKSHATCYAMLAYQTAYLKAHYPSEFMAATLNHASDIERITFFMEECTKLGIRVLPPHVNESGEKFTVMGGGEIRFGIGAIKGVGQAMVEELIRERTEQGPFTSFLNLMERANLRVINKKCVESLIFGGALDCFQMPRAQYFAVNDKQQSYIETALRYGSAFTESKKTMTTSLFGEMLDSIAIAEPPLPAFKDWSLLEKLNFEKEVTGFYVSGHPLDEYKSIFHHFVSSSITTAQQEIENQHSIGGLVIASRHLINKQGNGWGIFKLQDYTGDIEITLFADEYQKYKEFFIEGNVLILHGGFQMNKFRNRHEFKIKDIGFLKDAPSNMSKQVTLLIKLNECTPMKIEILDKLLQKYPGDTPVLMRLLDHKNRNSIQFKSQNRLIQIHEELILALESESIDFKIN